MLNLVIYHSQASLDHPPPQSLVTQQNIKVWLDTFDWCIIEQKTVYIIIIPKLAWIICHIQASLDNPQSLGSPPPPINHFPAN